MFVNLLHSVSFFSLTVDFVKQDRLKSMVSYVAFGILLVGTVYWVVASGFWQDRRIKKYAASSGLHAGTSKATAKQEPMKNQKVMPKIEEQIQSIAEKKLIKFKKPEKFTVSKEDEYLKVEAEENEFFVEEEDDAISHNVRKIEEDLSKIDDYLSAVLEN